MQAFERIKKWLTANAPDVELNPPADPKKIAAAERKMRLRFPEEFKAYLMTNDGQTPASHGAIGNWELLPLASILSAWQFQKNMVRDGRFTSNNENTSTPHVQGLWWNPRWIPLVYSASGDYICIDTDPNEEGTSGQVILFWHDDERRPLIAHSLSEWFNHIADDMESGKHRWVADKHGDGRFEDEAFQMSGLQDWGGHWQDKQSR